MTSSSEVVICTRNRPWELERCLDTVLQQSITSLSVFVVDGSDNDAATIVFERVQGRAPEEYLLKYVRTLPGLTSQRNLAIEKLEAATEFVHFIDDDVVLDAGYVSSIEEELRKDTRGELAGVGGLIQNLPPHEVHWLDALFLLDSQKQGVVLPSGVNLNLFAADRPQAVDWLSGCAMSFQRHILTQHRFDMSMEGYSLGEDVDFTFRLSRSHRLLVTPKARVWHYPASSGRHEPADYFRGQTRFRYRLVCDHPDRLSKGMFVWSCLGRIVGSIGRAGILHRDKAMDCARGTTLGLWDLAKSWVGSLSLQL